MTPTVSVAIPVHNGEAYLDDAIRSVRDQTFPDLEVIVSDNASEDATAAIARRHAAADPRVRYVSHDTNVGARENFNSAFRHARGEYFGWLAHDDAYASTFVEHAVEVFRARPEVMGCCTNVLVVDAGGAPVDTIRLVDLRIDSPRVSERVRDVLLAPHDCLPVFGLMRREALTRTLLIAPYANGDQLLLAQLALMGRLHVADDRLFISRRHDMQSNRRFNVWVDHHAYTRWFLRPGDSSATLLPQWRLARDLLRSLGGAHVPAGEWPGTARAVTRWLVRYRRLFLRDLTAATRARGARGGRREAAAAARGVADGGG